MENIQKSLEIKYS